MTEVPFPVDEPVVLDVTCRTSRRGKGIKHPVSIAPDWSVDTGHDLALERIGVAMGGYLSCVELVDRLVPCLRELWGHRWRQVPPGIHETESGRWAVAEGVAGCDCAVNTWSRPEHAAKHLRDVAHWSRRCGVEADRLGVLLVSFERASGTPGGPPERGLEYAGEVPGEDDMVWLWQQGVHPNLVRRMHAALGLDEPLRAVAYARVATGAVDLAWLVPFAPFGADAVAWAATTNGPHDLAHPDERLAWVSAGLNRRLIVQLLGGPYGLDDVRRLAASTGMTLNQAGRVLAGWRAADCVPSIDAVVGVCELDLSRYWPTADGITAIRDKALTAARLMTRTELGLLLVEAGSVTAAVARLRR